MVEIIREPCYRDPILLDHADGTRANWRQEEVLSKLTADIHDHQQQVGNQHLPCPT